jgi:tetratricopeptide (TPR) repeat protein
MNRWLAAAWLILGSSTVAESQEIDRARIESQAAGQASEADRLFKRGEWGPAMALYEAERVSRVALGDIRYEAYANRAIGMCKAELGDDEAAIEWLHKARLLDIKREDQGYAGFDLFLIAECELRLNRPLDAIKTVETALPMLSTAIDRDHEADARLFLTRLLFNLGRAEESKPQVARALRLAEELQDNWRIADCWAASGQAEGALGNLSLALERFSDAEDLFEQDGRAAEAAWMETISGSTLVLLGRNDLAIARFEEAARRHEHLEDLGSLAEDLSAIAGLQIEANALEPALASARKAVEKSQEVDDRPREIEARVRLSQVQGRLNDWKSAAETLDEAVLLVRQVARDDPAEQIRLILTAAVTDSRAKLDQKARERLDLARKIAEDSKQPLLQQVVEEARRQFENRETKPAVPPLPRM